MAKIYTSTLGDTWDSISYKLYGTEKHMTVLMEANSSIMSTVIFGAGVVLIVPEVGTQTTTNLPPWRR
ncbi:tail protein X [Tumebacillus permanentifrigoris]|uniref:Tail protein X n=1 Tax=Tumebacillus permanentifrigoris TaxID=378543 RepID=A0A316DZS9_9BACL|nr:tail protein X [Tumebacillus permanentifrigoris]PWK16060.1 tail protein X [Tumebacillus permanentifrigoris]